MKHATYPHMVGTLFDCPACESKCYCENAFSCVHCEIADERKNMTPKQIGYVTRFSY